jgi:hypothetical protein
MQVEKPRKKRFRNYAADWDDFLKAGLAMAEHDPARTRLVLKFRPRGNLCSLKVTDGTRIVMKKTRLADDFEKVENVCVLLGKLLSNVQDWAQPEPEKEDPEDKKKKNKKKRKGK